MTPPRKGDRLAARVALVTGAGSSGPGIGTGKAISVLFAAQGARVVLMDVSETAAAQTLAMVREVGGEAHVLVGDVTRAADCRRAVEAACTRYGKLDTLVNNVAVSSRAEVTALEEDDWDRVIDVNLKSCVLMAKAAIPALERAGGGAIVNIGSFVAQRAVPGLTAYTASKAGMMALTTLWAVEQAAKGIRCNTVCPGTIVTPMAAQSSMTPERLWSRQKLPPLGVEGTAWDVAWAALFLASEEARWITGATLNVDGGFTVATPQWGVDMERRRVG